MFVLKHKNLILDYYGEKYKGKATRLEKMSLKKALVWASHDETEELPFESMILGINREILGLTVREAGERFEFPFQAINRWEKKFVPNNENQEKLSSAMGFPRTEFFKAYWGLACDQPKIGLHVFNRKHTHFKFFDREAKPVDSKVALALDPQTKLLSPLIVQPLVSITEAAASTKVYIDLTREEIEKKS